MRRPRIRVVLLDNELIDRIEVPRFRPGEGGFQRRLDMAKVDEAIKAAQDGVIIPPIMVYDIAGRLVCGDGQHRLAARQRYNYPLFALIVKRTQRQAARDFCVLNGTARRVSLKHRLQVDTAKYAEMTRAMAAQFNADVRQVHNLMDGIRRGTKGKYPEATASDWRVVQAVMEQWTDDARWTNKSFIYNKPGVLKMVGSFIRQTKWGPDTVVRQLKRLNYSKNSSIANHYGAAASSQNRMRLMAYRELGLGLGTAPEIRQRQEA